MKLSTLLEAIESINPSRLNAERRAQGAKNSADKCDAQGPMFFADGPEPDIGSIHYRAQEVEAGGLFVAIPGRAADGHDFIGEALQKGASAIITQKKNRPGGGRDGEQVGKNVIIIQVTDSRKTLADLSARFYGDPSERLVVIGITGTNGKTTSAYLIESILAKAGCRIGVIGTINYRYGGKTFDNPITTPESLDLQRILAEMLQDGITHVVMEASSHAIDLYRIQNCRFDVAVFTNLSQDHLDFHGDMQSYWSSKKRLFTDYLNAGPKKDRAKAVINCRDSRGRKLADSLVMSVVRVGSGSDCMIKAADTRCDLQGIKGRISTPAGSFDFVSSLVGGFNLDNILCAAGVGIALRLPLDAIQAGVEAVSHIPGRLERIENASGRFVYVDYAHTPDALENVICALRAITADRIICVFGCGGDRDREKRPLMGEIAARLCDLSILTSDNPRTEEPLTIINQILEGTKREDGLGYSASELKTGFDHKGYVIEPDRQRAIELGIRVSRPGDTVLLAGKGHETYQILGKTKVPFDDREEARKALHSVGGR